MRIALSRRSLPHNASASPSATPPNISPAAFAQLPQLFAELKIDPEFLPALQVLPLTSPHISSPFILQGNRPPILLSCSKGIDLRALLDLKEADLFNLGMPKVSGAYLCALRLTGSHAFVWQGARVRLLEWARATKEQLASGQDKPPPPRVSRLNPAPRR